MIRSLFRSVKLLVTLVLVALAAFIFRDEISSLVSRALNAGGDAIEMAEEAEERERTPQEVALEVEATFDDIANGRGEREIRIPESELQLYIRHRLPVPAGVENLAIDLLDSTAAVTASLDFAELELEPEAVQNLRRFMGDSARVAGEVYGRMLGPGDGRLKILSLQAGVVPVPPFLIGLAAGQVGLRTDADGIVIPLVEHIVEIRVENEEVIIILDR